MIFEEQSLSSVSLVILPKKGHLHDEESSKLIRTDPKNILKEVLTIFICMVKAAFTIQHPQKHRSTFIYITPQKNKTTKVIIRYVILIGHFLHTFSLWFGLISGAKVSRLSMFVSTKQCNSLIARFANG